MLLVEHKSAGRDLAKAKEQALDYFPGLRGAELPRCMLVSAAAQPSPARCVCDHRENPSGTRSSGTKS